jgi:hypothetical protein
MSAPLQHRDHSHGELSIVKPWKVPGYYQFHKHCLDE